MAFNAEQIFLDALGHEPSADELQDIRLNLWMLTRAGFAVDDPSNAPLIAPWAWMWARLPRPTAPSASDPRSAERFQKSIETIEAILREIPAKLDLSALAAAVAERMPPLMVEHRIDGSTFGTALRESFTLIWIWLAAFGIGVAGVLGWHFGALHEQTTLGPGVVQRAEPPHHPPRVAEGPTRTRPRP